MDPGTSSTHHLAGLERWTRQDTPPRRSWPPIIACITACCIRRASVRPARQAAKRAFGSLPPSAAAQRTQSSGSLRHARLDTAIAVGAADRGSSSSAGRGGGGGAPHEVKCGVRSSDPIPPLSTLCVIRRGERYDVYDNDSDERRRARGWPKETTLQGLLRLNEKMYARTTEGSGLNTSWWETHARRGVFGNTFRD